MDEDRDSQKGPQQLATLYEISKLLTRIRGLEATVRAIFALMGQALSLQGALVLLEDGGQPKVIAWAAEGANVEAAQAKALVSYVYLVGPVAPPQATEGGAVPSPDHFITLPIVVEGWPIFGVLQVQAPTRPTEQDLMFVSAVANQLAIALDWRRITQGRQSSAEAATARAESLQDRYEAEAVSSASQSRIARQSSLARDSLLAAVSHDLRNQLNAILMSVTLLLRNEPHGEQQQRDQRNALTIQQAALGMDRLIRDLLDAASIEGGHMSLERQAEDAGTLVVDGLRMLEEQAASKGQRLGYEVLGPRFEVLCDRHRLAQVLANLVGNALKYTQAGGQIRVRMEAIGPDGYFAVTDTGAGIASQDLPHVFDRFWRGHAGGLTGTGLGMAITRGIIEAHGGRIWVESQEGTGTSVYFTLPLANQSC